MLISPLAFFGYNYNSSPSVLLPKPDNANIRLQLYINKERVDFSQDKFQKVGTVNNQTNNCQENLSIEPVRFHEKSDQLINIRWEGISGGEILKYYGLNYIGGQSTFLGYRLDKTFQLKTLPEPVFIYEDILPKPQNGSSIYVYVGGEAKNNDIWFDKRNSNSFIDQSLEVFFNNESLFAQRQKTKNSDWLSWFKTSLNHNTDLATPKVEAANNIPISTANKELPVSFSSYENTEKYKKSINLLGDVAVFIQNEEPSVDQIVTSFKNLTPLEGNSCDFSN